MRNDNETAQVSVVYRVGKVSRPNALSGRVVVVIHVECPWDLPLPATRIPAAHQNRYL